LKHSFAVLLVLLMATAATLSEAVAQQTDTAAALPGAEPQQEEPRGVALEPNYPNPFSRETRIPFVLGADLFQDDRPVVVTVRIYNVLRQIVAIPIALDHPTASGQPAQELRYEAPGRYLLLWDGRDVNGQAVSSGIYFCEIIANRSRDVGKMIVTR